MDITVTPLKRIGSLIKVSGAPASGIFVFSDFLAPVKGWVILLVFGLLMFALFVGIVLRWIFSKNQPEWWKETWWYKFTTRDKEFQWWWEGNAPWNLHGAHVPLVFAIVCIGAASASYAAAEKGGVLAQKIELVKTVQQAIGLLQKIADNTDDSDPCKKLANLGKTCNGETLLNAVEEGNAREVALSLQGGVRVQTAKSQGRQLPTMLALNKDNPEEILDLLVKHKVDPNRSFSMPSSYGPEVTILGKAIELNNAPLVKALLKHGVDLRRPVVSLAIKNGMQDTYALPAAIYGGKMEIAEILLDKGADKGLGDFAAYREAHAAIKHPRHAEKREALERILKRTAPPSDQAERVQDELRLADLMQEINDVGRKSILTSPYMPEKKRYEQRYAELQQERNRIEKKLGISPRQ